MKNTNEKEMEIVEAAKPISEMLANLSAKGIDTQTIMNLCDKDISAFLRLRALSKQF